METFDFPSLSHKMPSQILGWGLESQPHDFRRRKKKFFFFFHSKPSKLDKLHCTWSSKQDWRPSGAWSLENRLVILRTAWAGVSSPSQRRVFPDEIAKCGKRAENLKVSQLNAVPLIQLHCFWLKWIPRVTDGPLLKFQQQKKPNASDF